LFHTKAGLIFEENSHEYNLDVFMCISRDHLTYKKLLVILIAQVRRTYFALIFENTKHEFGAAAASH
jgi:hypothetical protein